MNMKVSKLYTEEQIEYMLKLEYNRGFKNGFVSGENAKVKSILEVLGLKKA